MQRLILPFLFSVLVVLCGVLPGCGGATPADAYAEELNEPRPASATTGSPLAELPDPEQGPAR